MIKHVHVRNFKSLEDVSVNLEPVTVLIGRSGTGKSNFVEALRGLRDYLRLRSDQAIQPWIRTMCATAPKPMAISFAVTFNAPGFTEDFQYFLQFQQPQVQAHPQFTEEKLCLGNNTLFHQREGRWLQVPQVANVPPPGPLMLGALTGLQESTIAYLVLTNGIGCYAFPDSVLTPAQQQIQRPQETGFWDNGVNYLQAFIDITVNLQAWQHLKEMAASLRILKPSLKSIDLEMPQRQQIGITHEVDGRRLWFDLGQESEGFRRMLACLIALNQSPPKETLIFDEPEKGIYPAGLGVLAEEFKGYASKGRGQVLLTTHSPDFLNHFAPEQVRVVEMHDYTTRIGPVAPEQMEALRGHYLEPKELLTVDEARLAESLSEGP